VLQTGAYCRLYCEQLDKGNCTNNWLTKTGWAEMRAEFVEATGLVHTTKQLSGFYRTLKQEWNFSTFLRYKASGIGRDEAGRPVATKDWWDGQLKVLNGTLYHIGRP
jgi:hypothetical protein